ncbi:MAG: hypothetical protein OEU09_17995, partial [Rhodospirillales bacterium]|nr:hypothetical protein [Rhodospirillales bacterium]
GPALLGLYALATIVLFAASWRRTAAGLGFVVLLIGGSAAYEWVLLDRESQRLTEVYHARNALLFEAGFRDSETYERRFGPFAGTAGKYPSGHWLADGPSRFSRLIVNGEGRAWLFFPCSGEAECAYGPAGTGLQPAGAGTGAQWRASLAPGAGMPLEVTIARAEGGRLTLRANDRSTVFAKVPPPIDPAPAARSLVYLGPFAQVACQGPYAKVRQVWLWREGGRLYAVGIFAPLVAGRHAGFVQPVLLGEGARKGEAWTFDWERNGRSWTATIALSRPKPVLTLTRAGQAPEHAALEAAPVFRDEAIEFAPLTAKADWDHWFEIMLVGHFSAGDIPAC